MVLLSGVLFVPGFAHAACPITPSFTYDPAAKSGGVATVWVNTHQLHVGSDERRELDSHSDGKLWYGAALLPSRCCRTPIEPLAAALSAHPQRAVTHRSRSSVVCAAKYTVTVDQCGL